MSIRIVPQNCKRWSLSLIPVIFTAASAKLAVANRRIDEITNLKDY